MIYLELLLSFMQIGLFSIGGGYAAMPLIQNQVVDIHSWLTMQQFADVMAIGAIRALHNNGLRVPRDVSVMGFDGLPLGSFLVPQLSTVIQSAQSMAQRSVEMLIGSIEEGSKARHEMVPFSLCSRESTRNI